MIDQRERSSTEGAAFEVDSKEGPLIEGVGSAVGFATSVGIGEGDGGGGERGIELSDVPLIPLEGSAEGFGVVVDVVARFEATEEE
jgi:hypothetical protein